MKRVYYTLSRLYPKSYRTNLTSTMRYAGMDMSAEIWLGKTFIISLFMLLFVSVLGMYGNPILFYTLALFIFVIYNIASYSIPYFQAQNRAKVV